MDFQFPPMIFAESNGVNSYKGENDFDLFVPNADNVRK